MRHWYGTITDENNRYVAHANLLVYTTATIVTGSLAHGDLTLTGTLENIYSDDGFTPIDQDNGTYVTTDSLGWAEFWVDAATVVLGVQFDGHLKRVITDVEVDGSGGGGGGTGGVPAGPITAGDLTMNSGFVLGRTSGGVGAIQELNATGLLTLSSGNATVAAASAGTTSTGTSTAAAVTPDGLAGSIFGTAAITLLVSDPAGSAITTGDGKCYYRVPSALAGMNLISVAASVDTVSSSGIPTIQFRRKRTGSDVDMLSTALTIDASETDSATAATPAVIDPANDDVATGDRIYIDIDVAGTGAKGLVVEMQFRLP